MPSPNILDEGMTNNDHSGVPVLLQAPHRPQPRLQAPMVALDAVVGIPVGAMPRRWEQLIEHLGYVGARSVTTSTGATLVVAIARSKHRRAALASR